MALRQVLTSASLSTSATNSNSIQLTKASNQAGVNIITFLVQGQMAGAQVKLQLAPASSGPWADIASTTISTSAISLNVEIADGFWIRPHLYSVSAGATSVDAWLGIGKYAQ